MYIYLPWWAVTTKSSYTMADSILGSERLDHDLDNSEEHWSMGWRLPS